ncbi:putative PPPDE peptidase domain, PPPDE putative peptidase domain superfamily [Helianthus annuus]|nr:putative PPPDE peptidase domain-containing protein [Helianthus annuus]KAJ0673610.1 putative PPPDE peptidase domain-containing protein [Helianthus annuus]KAJ0676968.1 putative PPPDE peptidase domain-containing protein [Helianthus annuus]KAJ0864948.1 putative PPPDE peptidase domain, PPPDE putative peptidase domain superfamily [Helianthus annuus]
MVWCFQISLFFFNLCLILMIHEKNDGWELVAVYGMEYAFGAHDYSISGVFEVEPRTCPGFIYRCSISLRHTNMSPLEFRAFIETIASEYNGDTYHLISNNCKKFTDDISHRLNCKGIPGWVN